MKKYEVIVEDSMAGELTNLLTKLPYVKKVTESSAFIDFYTLASEQSLAEDWLCGEEDDFQKSYGK